MHQVGFYYIDQKASVVFHVSIAAGRSRRSADIAQCAEHLDLTTGKWNKEET